MKYPLSIRFRLFSLTNKLEVIDANGESLLYMKQKLLRLRESLTVYKDSSEKERLFTIDADRIIDFSANYQFRGADGSDWGSVRRHGMRSLWSAHYEVIEDGQLDMLIQEEKPWKRFLEAILGDIPVIGFLAIYLICPSYVISDASGRRLFRVLKKPSVFERRFIIEREAEVEPDDEMRALLSLLMMIVLERKRG